MSTAKASVLERVRELPDDIADEMEIVERLYALIRFEHSRKRSEAEGVYADNEVVEHFKKKREQVLS